MLRVCNCCKNPYLFKNFCIMPQVPLRRPSSDPPVIRLALAESRTLLRSALAALLERETDFALLAQAADGRELLEQLKATEFDLLLLDSELTAPPPAELLRIIRLRFPTLRVLVLSSHADSGRVRDSISAGANGFLSRNCTPYELLRALKTVHKKGTYVEEALMMRLAEEALRGKPDAVSTQVWLSSREKEVLAGLCDGKTEKEIAKLLNISVHTVHFHRMKLHNKTRSHNLADLLRFAWGRISEDPSPAF